MRGHELGWLLALALGAYAQDVAWDPASGTTQVVELDGAAERSATFVYTARQRGHVHLHARAPSGGDPWLRAMAEGDALLAEDDDSGCGAAAFARVFVEADAVLRVTVGVKPTDGRVGVELWIVATSESALHGSAVERARAGMQAAASLAADDRWDESRARLAAVFEELVAVEGARDSTSVMIQLSRIAHQAFGVDEVRLAARAYGVVVEWAERVYPDDHPALQRNRQNLASMLTRLGDLEPALELQERAVRALALDLAPGDIDLAQARVNLASARRVTGDLHGARELLERALEVQATLLPDEDYRLQVTRMNLGSLLSELGEPTRARALLETALDVWSRVLAPLDTNLVNTRVSLAIVMHDMGDFEASRAVLERVVGDLSGSRPDDFETLQMARRRLASAHLALGEFDDARALLETVLAVDLRRYPEGSQTVQYTRLDLADVHWQQENVTAAGALWSAVLEASSALQRDHSQVVRARAGRALCLAHEGQLPEACALEEEVLDARARTLGSEHAGTQTARRNLALTLARSGRWPEALGHGTELACALQRRARQFAALLAPRPLEALAVVVHDEASRVLSLADGLGVHDAPLELQEEAFSLVETIRSIADASFRFRRIVQSAGDAIDVEARLDAIHAASDEVTRLARAQSEGVASERDAFVAAVRAKEIEEERLQRELAALPGAEEVLAVVHAVDIARALTPGDAAIGYWRYARFVLDPSEPARAPVGAYCYLAFVIRSGCAPVRIELGPAEAIDAAAENLRRWWTAVDVPADAAAVRAAGERLRRLVLDPLLPHIDDAQRLVVAPDAALQAIPLDALPLDALSLRGSPAAGGVDAGVVGDRWRVDVRLTLRELAATTRPSLEGEPVLLAIGGVDFGPADSRAEPQGSAGPWRPRFAPLPASLAELDGIVELHGQRFPEVRALRLAGPDATKESFGELARGARFLHVATHGYFAPPSGSPAGVRSTLDPRPHALASHLSPFGVEVAGLAPMVLCGLALSGANGAPDTLGRTAGILTAEELAGFDLAGCELAVLSACETVLGVERAGQGMVSLQRALHAAGARSVLASQWKVRDEAARELMVDFYRRVWIEGASPRDALWSAKSRLRSRRDASGRYVHSVADWAGWILTGE